MHRSISCAVATLLFASSIGCGARPDSDDSERGARSQGEALASYRQTIDPHAQTIVFEAAPGTTWMELHLTIDGTQTLNVPMTANGTTFSAGPLPLTPGRALSYSFTGNFDDGRAADSPAFDYVVPDGYQPTALLADVRAVTDGGYEAQLLSTTPIAWADLRYAVDGAPMLNTRMTLRDGLLRAPIALRPGDTVRYAITYAIGPLVVDTAWSTSVVGDTIVVDLSADSTSGVCVPNGDSDGRCNLRAAVAAAQGRAGATTIALAVDSTIDPRLGPIAVSAPLGQELTIEAQGPRSVGIVGGGGARLFAFGPGVTATLRNVAVQGFSARDEGGAIVNHGDLLLDDVAVSSNTVSCSNVGAMTASAYCSGGAIANHGVVTIGGGSRFERNTARADAETAAFTYASAAGGAIASDGTILVNGPVLYTANVAAANASSGYHGYLGYALASAGGGALWNGGGALIVTGSAIGQCAFTDDVAQATASAPSAAPSATSHGGAIASSGGTLQIDPGACAFSGNEAQTAPDVWAK